MLATPADARTGLPADGTVWAYEVKWDGMRALADVHEGRLRLRSRTERDVGVAFPELAPMAQAHPDALLDGEIVCLRDGVPSFAALAERFHVTDPRRAAALARTTPATLIAFDVLRLYGVDLTRRPWAERRAALERTFAGENGHAWPDLVHLSPVFDDGATLVAATREQGLEGVVAKRRTSRYAPGLRSGDWVKLPHRRVLSAVVGGWRPESGQARPGGRARIGALLLGTYDDDGGLLFAGRAGSGLTGAMEARVRELVTPLTTASSPFARPVPRVDAAGVTWVEPAVVVDVRFLGRSEEGRLRQPVVLGVREDLSAEDLRSGS